MNSLIAIYTGTQKAGSHTTYLLSCKGQDVFPVCKLVRKPFNDVRYILFDINLQDRQAGHRHFSHVFNFVVPCNPVENKGKKTKKQRLSGVNFSASYPNRCFADSKGIQRDDGILIEFSADRKTFTMYVFAHSAECVDVLFQQWNENKLALFLDGIRL